VVEELHPTLSNLIGRVEHFQVQGALVTNFQMIKAGALHRANGGTILIDALSLLSEPYSWSALKRTLVQHKIVIEDLAHVAGFASTVSLEPEAIPLNVKVILCGERHLYYLLARLDPEFAQHFKILADFDDDIDRSPENEAQFARLVSRLARDCGVRPLDRGAVERVIEQAVRLSDDSQKISLLVERMGDLVTEADQFSLSQWLRHQAPTARLINAMHANVDPAILFEPSKPSALRVVTRSINEDRHGATFDSATIEVPSPIDIEALAEVLDDLPTTIHRIKGFIQDRATGQWMVVQCVGNRRSVTPTSIVASQNIGSALVAIGTSTSDLRAVESALSGLSRVA